MNVERSDVRRLAGWGERTGAALVDLAIAGGIVTTSVVAGATLAAAGGWAIAAGIGVILGGIIAAILYAPLMLARGGAGNGQTLGKRAVGVRVVREGNEPVTFGIGLLREFVMKQLFGILLSAGLFWIVDSLWPLYDEDNRAIHDIVVETYVVTVTGTEVREGL